MPTTTHNQAASHQKTSQVTNQAPFNIWLIFPAEIARIILKDLLRTPNLVCERTNTGSNHFPIDESGVRHSQGQFSFPRGFRPQAILFRDDNPIHELALGTLLEVNELRVHIGYAGHLESMFRDVPFAHLVKDLRVGCRVACAMSIDSEVMCERTLVLCNLRRSTLELGVVPGASCRTADRASAYVKAVSRIFRVMGRHPSLRGCRVVQVVKDLDEQARREAMESWRGVIRGIQGEGGAKRVEMEFVVTASSVGDDLAQSRVGAGGRPSYADERSASWKRLRRLRFTIEQNGGR